MTPENQSVRDFVIAIYRYFLFRDPDPEGLQAYINSLSGPQFNLTNIAGVLDAFGTSGEFKAKSERFVRERLGITESTGAVDLLEYLPHAHPPAADQSHLLVTGQYRSGTSAMVSMLNFASETFVTHEFFSPGDARSWSQDAFNTEYHLNPVIATLAHALDLAPETTETQKEIAKTLNFLFPEIEFSPDFFFPMKRVLSGEHLLDFALKKLTYSAQHYSGLAMVGDKHPRLLNVNLPVRLLTNSRLKAVILVRDPFDMLLSATNMKELNPSFLEFVAHDFWNEVESSYKQIGELIKAVPERIIAVKYEGFFESEERIRNLFDRLGINPLGVNWDGVRYIGERSKLLSIARQSTNHRLINDDLVKNNQAITDKISGHIDWSTVI